MRYLTFILVVFAIVLISYGNAYADYDTGTFSSDEIQVRPDEPVSVESDDPSYGSFNPYKPDSKIEENTDNSL